MGDIMRLRYSTPALVLGLLAFPVLSSPDSIIDRYRFEIETASVTDLSEMGRGKLENAVYLAGELSVTFAEDGGINIVLDTVTGRSEGPGQPLMLAGLIGTTWTAVLDDKGRLSELQTVTASSTVASTLEGNILRMLFPYVTSGASVGDTWSDTLEFARSNYRMNYDTETDSVTGVVDSALVDSLLTESQETTTHIEYTAAADTIYNGVDALAVKTEYTSASTIYREPQGGIDIKGTSTGVGLLYIGSDGKYLGEVRQVESKLNVSGPQIPTIIPMTASSTITIELLP
jgi:hypothetical protein